MPPRRERPKRGHPEQRDSSVRSGPPSRADNLQKSCLENLPDEVLLVIFQQVDEKELCALSRTCKQFRRLSNDCQLWKKLYQDVFEYDLPLFRSGPCEFKFCEDLSQNADENPWKTSFAQLYHSSHVFPSMRNMRQMEASSHRHIRCFYSINSAIGTAKHTDAAPIIIIHAGIYDERVVVNKNIAIIGAGHSSFREAVIIDKGFSFYDGARDAYLGYVSAARGIDVVAGSEPLNPVIERCTIRMGSVVVLHEKANPTIRHCSISGGRGIQFMSASGRVEDNCIHDNVHGIEVVSGNPIITRNTIYGHVRAESHGILVTNFRGTPFEEKVAIEKNEIYRNTINILTLSSSDIIRNRIFGAIQHAIVVGYESNVLIEHNSFYDNPMPAITLTDRCHAEVKGNFFDRPPGAVVRVERDATVTMGENYF